MAAADIMTLDQFLADVDDLRSGRVSSPVTQMRLRYFRSWGLENSIVEMAMARVADSSVKIALYPAHSTSTTRSVWECFIDPLAPLDEVAQRSTCEVLGVLAPGRAVLVRVSGLELLSVSPLRMPIRGKKFGKE